MKRLVLFAAVAVVVMLGRANVTAATELPTYESEGLRSPPCKFLF
jgi:hypothetical protein